MNEKGTNFCSILERREPATCVYKAEYEGISQKYEEIRKNMMMKYEENMKEYVNIRRNKPKI